MKELENLAEMDRSLDFGFLTMPRSFFKMKGTNSVACNQGPNSEAVLSFRPDVVMRYREWNDTIAIVRCNVGEGAEISLNEQDIKNLARFLKDERKKHKVVMLKLRTKGLNEALKLPE